VTHGYQAQLGARGRLVLPAELRARHGWREGEQLRLIEDEDGTVRLLSAREAVRQIRGMYAHLVPPGVSIVDQFIADRHVEAASE